MNKAEQAVKEIHIADDAGSRYKANTGIHPLSHLIVTICYLLIVVSFHKYDISGLSGMVLYLVIQSIWYEISLKEAVRRLWPVFILTGMVGIANPFLDRTPVVTLGNVVITGGMLSMVTLMIKGILCVTASYVFVRRTGIRQMLEAFQLLHIPKELVTVLLLMHRYLIVLIKEFGRMQQAYRLRAPGQRGLQFRAWGSFVGLLLLRSVDRAGEVYESMQLRGFRGTIPHTVWHGSRGKSIVYAAVWAGGFVFLRFVPVFQIVGGFV